MTYTSEDAKMELMLSFTEMMNHDTDTFIELVEILGGDEAALYSAEEKIAAIKRLLAARNVKRQSIVETLQMTAAMIDPGDIEH